MIPQPYATLSGLSLLGLCIWREARGEAELGKRGVAHAIANRAKSPSWWGHDWYTVITKPYQFSSFNEDDPNSKKWPAEEDSSWIESLSVASGERSGPLHAENVVFPPNGNRR